MLVLIPAKPAAIVLVALAVLVLGGYVATALFDGRNPLSPDYYKAKQQQELNRYSKDRPKAAH